MKQLWNVFRKFYLFLPLLLLMGTIYIPFVSNLFFSNTEMLDNRALKTRPVKLTPQFTQQFTDYYNDTFAGRKKLIVSYVKLKQKLKIDTGQYFYGKEDWMFYDAAKINNGNSLVGYYGEARLNEGELKQLEQSLQKEKSFFEQFGAKYLLLVVPDKENIYSELMPDNMQRARVSDMALSDVAIHYLAQNTDIDVLTLKADLLSAKEKSPYPLYYPKDTHWNGIGAYIGFEALVKNLHQKIDIPELSADIIHQTGLVGQDMHPIDTSMSYTVSFLDDVSFKKTEIPEVQVVVYDNHQAFLPYTLMVAGDSFAVALVPYLAKAYKRVVTVPGGSKDKNFYLQLLQKYQPDYVVHELVERYFQGLLNRGKVFAEGVE